MRLKKGVILCFLISIMSQIMFSQDIHFSQFNASPLNLNPANTGNFKGDWRIVGNHRNQWSSVTVPFNTYSFSAERANIANLPISGGILLNHDYAGDSKYKTTQLNISASYTYSIDEDKTQFLIGGLQTGFTNRNINYNDLNFDAQYNGFVFNPNLSNGESFNRESRNYMNLSSGLIYRRFINRETTIEGGVSVYNLISPNQSFFNDNILLDKRWIIHAKGDVPINEKIAVLPSIFTSFQGKYKEIIFGASGRYILENTSGIHQAVQVGTWYRNQDAGYLSANYEYENWNFGISYDFNLSSLRRASNGRGGFEFSLIYIVSIFKPKQIPYRKCIDYI